ncbi:o-succinylbenzoate--CoA ligase [Avibacterium sp. 21-586]|uniref:o-succinylbenzoate--CoA ligase n=1 Tax=Avibacterium sp. 21-586 TaxID=2911534 RepID=UPI002245B3F8|nr:o-succinylbenzoate--CoA ligase [Avibacterium sp. 21-586]MCW9710689.1 o-succinylbenzoate--CoA ligase [Avibacterium sp. 21-586]
MTYLWQHYAAQPDYQHKVALRNEQGELFSWRQLSEKINAVACAFSQQGVKAGDGIALCGKNSFALLLAYLAGIQLGARVLGINPAFPEEKIAQLCENAAVQFYYEPKGEKILQNCTALLISSNLPHSSTLKEKAMADYDPNCPATMTLTSGSTGNPKAVVHTVQGHLDNAQGVCEFMVFGAENAWLLSLPLYHVSGQGIVWRWLYAGARLHLPNENFYTEAASVSHLSLVPTQLQRFITYLQQRPEQPIHTQHILLGGSHIPLALTQQAAQYHLTCYSGYGMTEMASTVCAKKSDQYSGVGLPLKGRELELIDGEICLRGAGLGLGYWQQGEILPLVQQDGWLHTKDLGEWQNGELRILGRLDNMFISGGENIQPEEIERIILHYPEIKQVVILPVEDSEFGQRPVAMVEFANGFSQSAVENLRIWLATKLEKFKQPIHYFPLDVAQWEKEGVIKISRNMLKVVLQQLMG